MQVETCRSSERSEHQSGVGHCKVCGQGPVAPDARVCPHCGANDPNPGLGNRYGAKGAVIGLVGGIVGGAIWGWFVLYPGWGGAIGGAMLLALAGLIVGLLGGWLTAIVAWLAGRR